MDHKEKIKIIIAAITAETSVDIDDNFKRGISNGLIRVNVLEKAEKEAMEPMTEFRVEHIQEGYGIWNAGGYDEKKRLGQSIVAAGPDGEKLRQVRYKKEVNGLHSLAVIYPGCYLAKSIAFDYYESADTIVYRVERVGVKNEIYLAECRKVLRINPRMSKLTETEEERLKRLIRISNQIAITPNLVRLKEGWV